MDSIYHNVVSKYNELFGEVAVITRAPGRINLLGEHVDYNGGFVMPAGVNLSTYFCLAKSQKSQAIVYSSKYDECIDIDLSNPHRVDHPHWANFLLGVLRQLVDRGYKVKPFNCVFNGDIPTGAGLSSSASIECGFAHSLSVLHDWRIARNELIEIAHWAETFYVGVKCGVMDQFATVMSAKDSIMVLDCRSMDYHYLPFNLTDHTLVLCDTKVKHSLVDSEYNVRREECEHGVGVIKKNNASINSLRDVTESMLAYSKSAMSRSVFDRCLYVVQEIDRVQQARDDLARHNLAAFGKKMYETHDGLSYLYQVSCPELDFLVDAARGNSSVLGARMMGAGFGGCTINIVENAAVEKFVSDLKQRYARHFQREMTPYFVTIENGTHTVYNNTKTL